HLAHTSGHGSQPEWPAAVALRSELLVRAPHVRAAVGGGRMVPVDRHVARAPGRHLRVGCHSAPPPSGLRRRTQIAGRPDCDRPTDVDIGAPTRATRSHLVWAEMM